MTWEVREGDCLDVLRAMPAESVQTCVTSPPYWGLRDYGSTGQLGLESTPKEYVANLVAVFREVKRVLRDDGTLWCNLGDSFMAGKQLAGIPWRTAFALQQPYYAGAITDERDRLWLAAMIDTEGSIGVNRLKGGEGHRRQDCFGLSVKVHNTSERLVRRCMDLAGCGSVNVHDTRGRPVFVWAAYGDNARQVLREVYPHLIVKQHEARCSTNPCQQTYEAMRLLHAGSETTIDRAAPESCFEPGWYLRSDIIWAKPNPMPESVTDRPTKAHEYLFLFAKKPQYFYDADAVREEPLWPDGPNAPDAIASPYGQGFTAKRSNGIPSEAGRNRRSVWTVATQPFPGAHFATFPPKLIEPCILAGSPSACCGECGAPVERTVDVKPSSDGRRTWAGRTAWHKTNEKLRHGGFYDAERMPLGWRSTCIHDDDSGRSVVLDPFCGSGTTGLVALRHDRSFIGIELSPEYAEMARNRIRDDAPLLNTPLEAVA